MTRNAIFGSRVSGQVAALHQLKYLHPLPKKFGEKNRNFRKRFASGEDVESVTASIGWSWVRILLPYINNLSVPGSKGEVVRIFYEADENLFFNRVLTWRINTVRLLEKISVVLSETSGIRHLT